jgi:hypothetical protein
MAQNATKMSSVRQKTNGARGREGLSKVLEMSQELEPWSWRYWQATEGDKVVGMLLWIYNCILLLCTMVQTPMCSMNSTWDLVRNSNSSTPSQSYQIRHCQEGTQPLRVSRREIPYEWRTACRSNVYLHAESKQKDALALADIIHSLYFHTPHSVPHQTS